MSENTIKRKASLVHKAFEIDGNKAECIKCKKVLTYSGPTSNLLNHVIIFHSEWWSNLSKSASSEDLNPDEPQSPPPKKSKTIQSKDWSNKSKKKSFVYKGFIIDSKESTATCKKCDKILSFCGTSNLIKHAAAIHPKWYEALFNKNDELSDDDDDIEEIKNDNEEEETSERIKPTPTAPRPRPRSKVSPVYKAFDIQDSAAICKNCKTILVFNGKTSNLTKHALTMHPMWWEGICYPKKEKEPSENSSLDLSEEDRSRIEKGFDVQEMTATCKNCKQNLAYTGHGDNLIRHAQQNHPIWWKKLGEKVLLESGRGPIPNSNFPNSQRKRTSPVYRAFEINDNLAVCNCCKNNFTFSGNTSNLIKHAAKMHPKFWDRILDENESWDNDFYEDEGNGGGDETGGGAGNGGGAGGGEEESLDESSNLSPGQRKKKSPVYKAFRISETSAICGCCKTNLTFSGNTSNLIKHAVKFHPKWWGNIILGSESPISVEQPEEPQEPPLPLENPIPPRKSSPVYRAFDISESSAICKKCKTVLAFSGTTSNLIKHAYKMHLKWWSEIISQSHKSIDDFVQDSASTSILNSSKPSSTSSPSVIIKKERKKLSPVHIAFQIIENKAKCRKCGKVLAYLGTTSNLLNHAAILHRDWWEGIKMAGKFASITSIDPLECNETDVQSWSEQKRKRQKSSLVHQAFDVTGIDAICKFCNGKLTYKGTTSNLLNHVTVKHPKEWKEITKRGDDEDDDEGGIGSILEITIKEEYLSDFEMEPYEEHIVDLMVDTKQEIEGGSVDDDEDD